MRVIRTVLGSFSHPGTSSMDAYFSGRNNLTYLNESPILVVGSSETALANAARLIETSGLRVADRTSIETARERIERQVSACAIWVELDRDAGPAADELMKHVSRDVADGRYAAVVSATAELIDPVTSLLGDSSVELIIDADEADRAAALALAGVKKDIPARLSDVATDRDAARLRQLSEEVSRIASTLA